MGRPWTSRSHKRLKIGEPTDFRHLADVPRRRHSFSRLELSIYIAPGCKLSPLPNFDTAHWSSPTPVRRPKAALLAESCAYTELDKPHVGISVSNDAPGTIETGLAPFTTNAAVEDNSPSDVSTSFSTWDCIPGSPAALDNPPAYKESAAQTISQPSPAAVRLENRRARSRGSSCAAASGPITPVSQSHGSSELGSKRFSIRHIKSDVEEAIKELKTIVEERRGESLRTEHDGTDMVNSTSQTSGHDAQTRALEVHTVQDAGPPSPHVPALVPTMKVHVRSETLSDIGSAFSMSLKDKRMLTVTPHGDESQSGPMQAAVYGPSLIQGCTYRGQTSHHSPATNASFTTGRSSVSTWLRRSLSRPISSRSGATIGSGLESEGSPVDKELVLPRSAGHGARETSAFFLKDVRPNTASCIMSPPAMPSTTPPTHFHPSTTGARTPPGKVSFATHLDQWTATPYAAARHRGFSIGVANGVPAPPAYDLVNMHAKGPLTSSTSWNVVGVAY